MAYLYIVATILLTVYGQLVLKWQMNLAGPGLDGSSSKVQFVMSLFTNLWILSAFVAAFAASLAWMAAMTKFQLSHAYPFMSLNFVLVLALAGVLFNEPITAGKLVGTALIVLGVVIGSQG